MSVIPCQQNEELQKKIDVFVEVLKVDAHQLGTHGMSEYDFYNGGLFRGAIESLRGEFSASMGAKREFARDVLNYLQDKKLIVDWESSGDKNRHDYTVRLPNDRVSVIELKGCMDGNNTTIYERPPHAHEFIVWSLCTNAGGDPRKNAWSGIHTRIGADMLGRAGQRVDGVIIWDMMCGTIGRPCPKLVANSERITTVTHYQLPPPCIYVLPATVASPRNNPKPKAQTLEDVHLLRALHVGFGGADDEVNYVDFEASYKGNDLYRVTRIHRGGKIVRESRPTAMKRV